MRDLVSLWRVMEAFEEWEWNTLRLYDVSLLNATVDFVLGTLCFIPKLRPLLLHRYGNYDISLGPYRPPFPPPNGQHHSLLPSDNYGQRLNSKLLGTSRYAYDP